MRNNKCHNCWIGKHLTGCIAWSASELSACFTNLHVEKVLKEAQCGLTQNAVIPISGKSKLHFLIWKSVGGWTHKELKITAKSESRNYKIVADFCSASKNALALALSSPGLIKMCLHTFHNHAWDLFRKIRGYRDSINFSALLDKMLQTLHQEANIFFRSRSRPTQASF